MAADRVREDRDDAKLPAPGQSGGDGAFGDAEDGPIGDLTAQVQSRIAITANDESIRFVIGFHVFGEERRDTDRIRFAFDPKGSLRKGDAIER